MDYTTGGGDRLAVRSLCSNRMVPRKYASPIPDRLHQRFGLRFLRIQATCECELSWNYKCDIRIAGTREGPPAGGVILSQDCELDHIPPRRSGVVLGIPDGASRFQCPGLARSLTAYCVDGLVLFGRPNLRNCAVRVPSRKVMVEPWHPHPAALVLCKEHPLQRSGLAHL